MTCCAWMHQKTILLPLYLNLNLSTTITITWLIGLDRTKFIDKTKTPNNIKINKSTKYTKLRNILPYEGNEIDLYTGYRGSCQIPASHCKIWDIWSKMWENYQDLRFVNVSKLSRKWRQNRFFSIYIEHNISTNIK